MILIDKEDEYWLDSTWSYHKVKGLTYVRIHMKIDGKWRSRLLHRLIMQASPDINVDHIDGNGLNNCRSNLRFATHSQNMANTGKHSHNKTGFKGVSQKKNRNKWTAQITKNRKVHYLGNFKTVEEAAVAYDKAAKNLHGEFAYLNFP